MQRVRHRVAVDDRERDHVADGDRTAETPLDAREAQVVGYAEPEGVPPDAGAQHAVVACLDHVDTAIVAAAARDLAGRELVVHRQLLSTGLVGEVLARPFQPAFTRWRSDFRNAYADFRYSNQLLTLDRARRS